MGDVRVRTLVVRCPDWSVYAAQPGPSDPLVVVRANRVVACSMAARSAGVEVGLRRREAQRRCPEVKVVGFDPGRDLRAFERVAACLDEITPGVEITSPGMLSFGTRGPSRYFGGDEPLGEKVLDAVRAALDGRWPAYVGIADGFFSALRASHQAQVDARESLVVPVGCSDDFLASHPTSSLLEVLDVADLVDVWVRLGLSNLGLVSQLSTGDISARFGPTGLAAHRVAKGFDLRPLDLQIPEEDLSVSMEFEDPLDRVDRGVFAAKALAEQLNSRLSELGVGCTRVQVYARTQGGEELSRQWRHEGTLSDVALAQRVRWQLDGWLSPSSGARSVSPAPSSGLVCLSLTPLEVQPDSGRQLGFWGGESRIDERVSRAIVRLQSQLGTQAVRLVQIRGARDPAQRVHQSPAEPDGRLGDSCPVDAPWPGQVPSPAPAVVFEEPLRVLVLDEAGREVGVSGRGELSAAPAVIERPGCARRALIGWAGPWLAQERWWDNQSQRRRVRFQVIDDRNEAMLLCVEGGLWWLEAAYQ